MKKGRVCFSAVLALHSWLTFSSLLLFTASEVVSASEFRSSSPVLGQYKFPTRPHTPEQILRYNGLSDEKKKIFRARKLFYRTQLIEGLEKKRVSLGFGSLTVEKFKEFYHRNDIPNPIFDFEGIRAIQAEERAQLTLDDRGHKIVQDMATLLDEFCWDHAQIISGSNKFGLSIVFLGGEVGVKCVDEGGCVAAGLGVTLSYNHQSRVFSFDLFSDAEKMEKVFPAVVQASVFGRAAVFIESEADPYAAEPIELQVVSPVGFVVAALAMSSPQFLSVGLEGGIGVPPWEVVTAYSSELTRVPLLKFVISSRFTGFAPGSTLLSRARITKCGALFHSLVKSLR